MKTLNEVFTDEEAKELMVIKMSLGLSWHDFIMILTKLTAKQIREYTKYT